MPTETTVRHLAGFHIGQHVTVKTKHIEATGVLQGFRHDTAAINDIDFSGDSWVIGSTRTTIMLLPGQDILAEMGDEVVVHGDETDIGPQGPRTVEVLYGPTMIDDYSRSYIRYGQAITGWPIRHATILDAPRNDADREWLDTYLPCWITPDGEINHDYKEGADGWEVGDTAHYCCKVDGKSSGQV